MTARAEKTRVSYHAFPKEFDWLGAIKRLIAGGGVRTVADLGAGAHPILDRAFVDSAGLDYTIFDVSSLELERAGNGYRKVVADVTADDFAEGRRFDLVLSRWVLEHIADPNRFHRNVFSMLPRGGRAVHFFPTLYSAPFVVNRLLPETASKRLLGASLGDRSKFPARYRWCRGPTQAQLLRLRSTGFEIEEYVGFYGHPYFRRIGPLDWLERRSATFLERNPVPALTSFASVTLVKEL